MTPVTPETPTCSHWTRRRVLDFVGENGFIVIFVLWCLFRGLFVSNVIGVPEWLRVAVRTEYYIKTGLVILGSGILFGEIVKAGAYGIVQAVLVVAVVWYLTWWVARKMKVDDEFSGPMA